MSQPIQPIQPPPYGQQPPPLAPPPVQAKRKRFGWLALILTAVIALGVGGAVGSAGDAPTTAQPAPTAAAAPTATDEATASATPSANKMQRYDTVTELSSAAIAAGYRCPNWQVNAADGGPLHAQESGSCSDEDVFAVYATDGDLNDQEELIRASGATPTLVGINWTIHSTTGEIPTLQRALGGHLIEEEPEPEPKPQPEPDMGEGTYEVGKDVRAGQYKTTVPDDSSGCYWERSKDDSGDSIITNDLANPGARVSVTTRKGEFFKSNGCGDWVRQ